MVTLFLNGQQQITTKWSTTTNNMVTLFLNSQHQQQQITHGYFINGHK